MSKLLTTTGLSLLCGTGIVSLPAPAFGGGVIVPPPPPATNWYDLLFAKRDGTGAGAQTPGGGYTSAAAYDAATAGVAISGSEMVVSGNNVVMQDVDLSTTPYAVKAITADGLTVDNVITSIVAGELAQFDLRESDHTVRNVTINNPSKIKGVPSVLVGHISGATGTHLIDNLYLPLACGDIKGANNGITQIRNVVMTGVIWGANAHFDAVDWRGSLPGSFAEDCLFVADADPSSASGVGTGYNNVFRCADGNIPVDLRHSRIIAVGSDFPGNNSYLISIAGGGSGVIFEDWLIDVRSQQQLWYPGSGGSIEDWHEVRAFSWSQSLADGFITPGALIPFPNLADFPATIPNQMSAPVITALPGGFTYAAMTRPWNQRSQITGYTLEWSTDGTTWNSEVPSLDGGFVPTGAATNVRARVYATNGIGNSTRSVSSNILPTITATSITLSALPWDGFVFDAASTDSVQATLRGTGTAGALVEARGESAGGNTAWFSGTVDGSGNWAIAVTLDANAGNWYTPAARISGDDSTKKTHANTFAGGDVITFGPSQSEPEYTMAVSAAFNVNPYPTLLAQNLTMLTLTSTGGTHTSRRITSTGINLVNVAMVALANLFHRVRPGRKFCIIDQAISGQGRQALHNDANTGFFWSDLSTPAATIRAAGGEIGHVIECWYNANASTIRTFGNDWAPFYFGQRWGGSAFTLGVPNPDAPAGNVDHPLWDIEVADDQYGRGLYKRSRTKLHLLLPMPFHDTLTTEQRNFTHDSTGAAAAPRITHLDRPARDAVATFGADSRVQEFLAAVGPSAHIVDFGGGIHPLPDDPFGSPQFAMQFAPAVLRASGYMVSEPTIDGANVVRGPAGAYADVPVLLPNGGTLTTIRQFASIAAPGTEPPHYQPVVGFEIRRAADADSARRPVMKLTETSYPVDYRGTVTIVDSGSGTPRKGWVRITPATAFATGDRLEYLRGQASAHLVEPRDVTARLFLDMLIEHVPAMYFAADTYPFYGVSVRPQPSLMTLP